MSIQSIVKNELIEDNFSVWCLKNHEEFGYSDGARSEKYLRDVFNRAKDLSTRSTELESFIKDWPSEYHLSTKRAQLLSGFSFERASSVLEVGCGCGAITRYLGENFNQVTSVEGSIGRARIARQRARDLESVAVVCAPFQELRFKQKFDIIFCIGVFEYSASFIEADDPYEAALRYFSDMLTPDGCVVIAIENQFGLKYFSGIREDHLGVAFEGIEGYHRWPGRVRTFGKTELEARLKKYFAQVQFYYPYPDYKLPQCVISNEFLASGDAGELVSQIGSRDYAGRKRVFWSESLAALELSRNAMLDFFSNSHLVIASRGTMKGATFNQHAVIFSSGRKAKYSTRTRILSGENGQILVEKRLSNGSKAAQEGPVKLVETQSPWIGGLSIHMQIVLRVHEQKCSLGKMFEPCKNWIDLLVAKSTIKNEMRYLDGADIDSIWSNTFLVAGECSFIDREWIWEHDIRLNVVVIRAIYDFLSKMETSGMHSKAISKRSGKAMIRKIAATVGVELVEEDFAEFIRVESEFQWIVTGKSRSRQKAHLRWFLADRPTRKFVRRYCQDILVFRSRILDRILNRF